MSGWLKLHRSLIGHWITNRPEWYAAWIDILLCTDYQTGEVNLTHVPAKRHFSSSGWNRFVKRLEAEGMLEDLQTVRLGKGVGSVQTAVVSNWSKFNTVAGWDSKEKEVDTGDAAQDDTSGAEADAQGEQVGTQGEWDSNREQTGNRPGLYNPVTDETNPPTVGTDREQTGTLTGSLPFKEDLKTKTEDLLDKEAEDHYNSSEARHWRVLTGKGNDKHKDAANRTHLRRLIGRENFDFPQVQNSWQSWYSAHEPEHIEETWRAAHREANLTGKGALYLFIDSLNGRGTPLVRKATPAEPSARPVYDGPQPGTLVQLPDGTITEVADFDQYGNWVLFNDHDPLRPQQVQPVEAQRGALN